MGGTGFPTVQASLVACRERDDAGFMTTITFITGANKGLGYETARRLDAAADIEAHEGRVDTLINNAGIIGRHAPASDLTGEDAEHVFATNVTGIVRVTGAFLPLLRNSQAPAVINVSSGMGSQA